MHRKNWKLGFLYYLHGVSIRLVFFRFLTFLEKKNFHILTLTHMAQSFSQFSTKVLSLILIPPFLIFNF